MQVCFKHSLSVINSRKLSLKEKIDGLLLLNVYFVPIITLLSFVVSVLLMIIGSWQLVAALWFFVPVSLYSCVGNFAPFFEIGIGAYLDGRTRTQWLTPLLLLTFLYNIPICTKALLDICWDKLGQRGTSSWSKTPHLGNGNFYATRQGANLEGLP
jgi:hypothetical protein